MKLKTAFKGIAWLEMYPQAKPNMCAYLYVTHKFNLKKRVKTYFFEDTLENLESAKKLGWITVFISKNIKKHKYVDYIFPNIETAIKRLCPGSLFRAKKRRYLR